MVLDLGGSTNGARVGNLIVQAPPADPGILNPGSLVFAGNEKSVATVRNGAGIRQVLTPYVLTDVITLANGKGYQVNFHDAAGASLVNGLYVVNTPWFTQWEVKSVGEIADSHDIIVTETRRQQGANDTVRTTHYHWPSPKELEQTFGSGPTARIYTHTRTDDPECPRWSIASALSEGAMANVLSEVVRTYTNYDFGERLIEEVIDPYRAELTNTWRYGTLPENPWDQPVWPSRNDYTRLVQMTRHDGYWERYTYDAAGRGTKTWAKYLDAPPGNDEVPCRTITYQYTQAPSNPEGGVPDQTITEAVLGVEVSRRTTRSTHNGACTTNIAFFSSAQDAPGLTNVTWRRRDNGETLWRWNSDGTATTYTFVTNNHIRTVTKYYGAFHFDADNVPVVDVGTKTITTYNPRGIPTDNEVRAYPDTSIVISKWSVTQSDSFGRPLEVVYGDGTEETMTYGCCDLDTKTGRDGITTHYAYDQHDRRSQEIRQGITTTYTYDAAGQVVKTELSRGGAVRQLSTSTYNRAGRLTATTDALGNVTTYSESVDDAGRVVRTTTHPDGATEIHRSWPDGLPDSVEGTAVRPVRYEHGAANSMQWTKEIKVGEGLNADAEWMLTWTDFAGRQSLVEYADGTSAARFFDDAGRLVKTVDRTGLVMLFEQDALGRTQTRALDVDRDDTIDYGSEEDGSDRVQRTVRAYEIIAGHPWETTTSYLWMTDNNATPTPVGVTQRRLDGDETKSLSFDLETHTTSTLELTANGPMRTTTTTAPDQTYTVTVETNGMLSRVTRYRATAQFLSAVTNGYDSWNRRIYVADGRGRRIGTIYNEADQPIASTVSEGETVLQTTSYTYDQRGRVLSITHPDGGVVNNQYYPSGDLMMTWGARTYPVGFTYDPQGRMRTMVTWRNFEQDSGRAVTEWIYNPLNGTLQAKKYADGSMVEYTYGAGGRLATRQWARGVTTTYRYNGDDEGDLKTGDLKEVDYSDNTADITYTYNRLGRVATVTDGAGTRTDTYNSHGARESEDWTFNAGPISSARIARGYDTLHRLLTMTPTVNDAPLSGVTYGYDAAGRMNYIGENDRAYTYGYDDVGDLITSLLVKKGTQPKLAIARSYDLLNRLTSIVNTPPGGTAQSWTYTYNDANQRTRATLADGSYWSYAYDPLGQVIGGSKKTAANEPIPGMQFGYWFDDIGNRRTETNNARVSAYTANALNQYTERTVPGVVDIIGEATAGKPVVVNSAPATRLGTYFHAQVGVDNADEAAYPEIKAIVGQTGSPDVYLTETKGRRFVAKTPEEFDYDEDGNLTQDGRWMYTWDGENRLIKMETIQAAIDANVPYRCLEFTYDANSRRVGKKMSSGSHDVPVLESTTAYLYDGWNLVTEVIRNPQSEIRNSYAWGLDLSGSLQGAGGVGGLLSCSLQSPASSLTPCYDGNGNVMALVDTADKSIVASYEYDPFGNTLRATGEKAAENPFRFSTKYTDDETGLVYYGFRYYAPVLGRWLSRDPIVEHGGNNLYRVLNNDLLEHVDLFGLLAEWEKRTISIFWPGESSDRRYDISYSVLKFCKGKNPVMYTKDLEGNLVGALDAATLLIVGADVILKHEVKDEVSAADCPKGWSGNKLIKTYKFTVVERVGFELGFKPIVPIEIDIIVFPIGRHYAQTEETLRCCTCDRWVPIVVPLLAPTN